jgi:hypothetical protein
MHSSGGGTLFVQRDGQVRIMAVKRTGMWFFRLLPFPLLIALAWYQLPGLGPWKPGEVVAFRYSSYRQAAFGVVLVVWILLLATLLWRGLAARVCPTRWHRRSLLSALVAVPVLVMLALGAMAFDWHEVCHLRLQDSSVYRVRRSLPAYLLTLEVRRGPLLRWERIIGYGDTDFPALLVRPAGGVAHDRRPPSSSPSPSLAQSADGRWLAVLMALDREGPDEIPSCQTHLVYDRRTGKVHDVMDLADISPFIFIGPRDRLDASDVRALLSRPGQVRPVGLTLIQPSAATIARDLGSENPDVRGVAARLLDSRSAENSDLGTAADILRHIASASTDAVARHAAERALARVKAAQQER